MSEVIAYVVERTKRDYREPDSVIIGIFTSLDKAKEGVQAHLAKPDVILKWAEHPEYKGTYLAYPANDITYTIKPYILDALIK